MEKKREKGRKGDTRIPCSSAGASFSADAVTARRIVNGRKRSERILQITVGIILLYCSLHENKRRGLNEDEG